MHGSVIGTSHLRVGAVLQDCNVVVSVNDKKGNPWLCCLIADGAGSSRYGNIGAESAVYRMRDFIREYLHHTEYPEFTRQLILDGINSIREEIHKTSLNDNTPTREYATTLAGAVIGCNSACFFQIGDGAAIATTNAISGVVFWPEESAFANSTFFLTDVDFESHLQFCSSKSCFDEVALFTDGLQRLALAQDSRTVFLPFFEPMMTVLRKVSLEDINNLNNQLALFLSSTAVNARTDDDKTLVLATRLYDCLK